MSGLAHLERADFGPHTMRALARANRQPSTSFVYFIASATHIKIGLARDVTRRLASLQTGSPTKLCLLGTLAGDHELERELHHRYAAQRAHGEWFDLTPDLEALLHAAYEAGSGKPWDAPADLPTEPRGEWLSDDLGCPCDLCVADE